MTLNDFLAELKDEFNHWEWCLGDSGEIRGSREGRVATSCPIAAYFWAVRGEDCWNGGVLKKARSLAPGETWPNSLIHAADNDQFATMDTQAALLQACGIFV